MNISRAIERSIIINSSLSRAWEAWTTEDGVTSFLAPACNIEIVVDGFYEIYFMPDSPAGERGSEGARVLAFEKECMFSFTWNAPPHLVTIRTQKTYVTIYFEKVANDQTKVILVHGGWGMGAEWCEAFEYFTNAWTDVVLPRLKQYLETGPLDWGGMQKGNASK